MKSEIKCIAAALVASFAVTALADSIVVDGVTWGYTVNSDGTTVSLDTVNGSSQISVNGPEFDAALIPWTFTVGNSSYTVTSYTSALFKEWQKLKGELTIPGTVKGTLGVFTATNNNLTKITLCEGIEKIPWYCFKNCKKVDKSIVIPSTVTEIEGGAFSWCSKLPSAWVKGGKTSNTKVNVRHQFAGTKVKLVYFGKNTQGAGIGFVDKSKNNETQPMLQSVTGCLVYAPDNSSWVGLDGYLGGTDNTVRYYGPGRDVDLDVDDESHVVTVTANTAEALEEAINYAPTFKNDFGLDMVIALTNRMDMGTTVITEDMLQNVTLTSLPWYLTFKVDSQEQLNYVLSAVDVDVPIVIDIEGAGHKKTFTVPEGRKVAILAKSGWEFGPRRGGLVVTFK